MRHFEVRWAGRALAVAAAVFLLCAVAGAADSLFTKGPYLANAGPAAVTIHYETASPGDGIIQVGTGGAMNRQVPATLFEKYSYPANPKDKSSPQVTAYLYRARLADLAPGTAYQYQVLPTGKGGPASAPKTFRTFPVKPERITFIAYGDTRSKPAEHRTVVAAFLRQEPLFILHSGDLVTSGSSFDLWSPQFFTPLADIIDHIPVMVTMGNHERAAENLLKFFDLPAGKTWYSFDCGPVHVTVLNDRQATSEAVKWLDQDLAASKAPWKIAMHHAPSFNFEGHKSDAVRPTFLPLYEKYGVDVVVTGHSHLYERFKPLARKGPAPAGVAPGVVSPHPITFITAGGGGAPLAVMAGRPMPSVLAKTQRAYHYCVFSVDAESLSMDALLPDGAKIDSLAITKKNGRYDDAYLAQVRPMEEAILQQGVIPMSAPAVESLPNAENPGTITMRVRFPGLGAPVALVARLTDASAAAYAMEPVAVEVAPNKEANVILKVRALKNVVAEKGDKLKPEPRFILTAKACGYEATCETGPLGYRISEKDKAKAKAADKEKLMP
jgi:predicted phosphodiesterase